MPRITSRASYPKSRFGNKYFSKPKMVALIASKGYYHYNGTIAEVLNMTTSTVTDKLNHGTFTWEDTFKLARAFRMTFTEFYEIFLDGLYDRDGNLIRDEHYKELEDRE